MTTNTIAVEQIDAGLAERCLRFVENQSSGEWGEAIENSDAALLVNFVRDEIARHRHQAEARLTHEGSVDPELVKRVQWVADAVGKDRHWKAASLTSHDWRRIAAMLSATPPGEGVIPAPVADNAKLVEALRWYAEQVGHVRKNHSEGEAARNALDRDCGDRARAALFSIGEQA